MNDFWATVFGFLLVALFVSVAVFVAVKKKQADPSICSCPSGKLQMHTDFAGDRVVYRFECDEK